VEVSDMAVIALIIAAIAALANVVKTLPELGINIRIFGRDKVPLANAPRRQKAWIGVALSLASLALCGGAFYYFFRPRVVDKIIEKPVDRIVEKVVEKDCPKSTTPSVNKPKRSSTTAPAPSVPLPTPTQECQGGNCAISNGQQGGITAGLIEGTPPVVFSAPEVKDVVPVADVDDAGQPIVPAGFKYEKQVIVRVNEPYTPVSIGIVCDAKLGKVKGGLAGPHSQVVPKSGITDDGKSAAVYFEGSPATPTNPIVVRIWADNPFSVLRVVQAKITVNSPK
jgi:hypothetical protein